MNTWDLADSVNSNFHILLGSVGQWLECFHFAPHHHPQPDFCYPLCPLVDPSSRQNGLLAISGAGLSLLLVFFLFLLLPTVDYHPSITACQNPICPSKGREADDDRVLPVGHFDLTESLQSSLWVIYSPHFIDEEGSEKLLTCLRSHSWKVAKLGIGIFNPISLDTKPVACTPHTPTYLLKFCLHESPMVILLPSLLLFCVVAIWGSVLWHACARCPEGLWHLRSDSHSGTDLHCIHYSLHLEVNESLAG